MTGQKYQGAELSTFGQVLQRTLACKARFERLLDLLSSSPVMMRSGGNRCHVVCAASATSFEPEWQRHGEG